MQCIGTKHQYTAYPFQPDNDLPRNRYIGHSTSNPIELQYEDGVLPLCKLCAIPEVIL